MERLTGRVAIPFLLLVALIGGGCGHGLADRRMKYHDEYFVRQPGLHPFDYSRRFSDGSVATGKLVYRITGVTWGNPASAGYSYRMAGEVTQSTEGVANGLDAAVAIVPFDDIKAALPLDNVDEVFAREVLGDGLVRTTLRRDRVNGLKLPLAFRTPPRVSAMDSGLHGNARNWAAEVGLVWLKDILLRTGLLNLSGTFTVTDIRETDVDATIVFRHGDAKKADVYSMAFRRGQSLVAVQGVLADGSHLSLTETVRKPEMKMTDLKPVPFDHWYAMNDEKGQPQGYAHLVARLTPEGSLDVKWQLRLAFADGTYEEDRAMVLDREMRLVSASYSSAGDQCEARRDAGNLRVTTTPRKASPRETVVPAAADALPGMDFALAAFLPQVEGTRLDYAAVNEADGFKGLGAAKMTVRKQELIPWQNRMVSCWRIERESKQKDKVVTLPVWVDGQGRIIQVDWGGGNLMVLSTTPTTHLFKPSAR